MPRSFREFLKVQLRRPEVEKNCESLCREIDGSCRKGKCDLEYLDEMTRSSWGFRYAAIEPIDAALQLGGHVDLLELPANEFADLKILKSERDKAVAAQTST